MGLGVLLIQVVAIIGGHQRNTELAAELNQALVDLFLGRNPVVLQFQKIIPFSKDLLVVPGRFLGLVHLVGQNILGNVPFETGGQRDEAFGVGGEQCLVDPWLVVVAFHLTDGGQLAQVAVPLLVFGQQHHVTGAIPIEGGFVGKRSRGHVAFATDNGFDAGRGSLLVEIQRAEHGAVVGDCYRRHTKGFHFFEQVLQSDGPVQQAVLGMDVQMDKISRCLGHDL